VHRPLEKGVQFGPKGLPDPELQTLQEQACRDTASHRPYVTFFFGGLLANRSSSMKIGFLCSEYFYYRTSEGKSVPTSCHGGFGVLTRKNAEGLSRLGHDVHVLIPAPSFEATRNERRQFPIDGVTVHLFEYPQELEWRGYAHAVTSALRSAWASTRGRVPALEEVMEEVDADVYVSENPSLYSCAVPTRRENHVLVFQDPWSVTDLNVLRRAAVDYARAGGANAPSRATISGSPLPFYDSLTNLLGTALLRRLMRRIPMKCMFGEARCISDRAQRLYRLPEMPDFLPNPIDVPESIPVKEDRAVVSWIGRWDPQKRVDIALETARSCPEVEFFFIGSPTDRSDLRATAQTLEKRYARYENIHVMRFVTEEEKNRILDRSWILLNTSVREGLPITFLEAAAHGVSIIAPVDPDEYASKFGTFVPNGDFVGAIRQSVRQEDFRTSGQKGYEHVRRVHETNHVIQLHAEILSQFSR